ncbi:MAG: Fe-S-containing hydro-lyase [Planctomycetota bacterium]|jgi:fumarate hydratase subunit beta
MSTIKIYSPLVKKDVLNLHAGDVVLLSGVIYTARDMAHKRLYQSLELGEKLPFELEGAVIYYVGPSPPREGKAVGAAGPTTSSRMDAFSPVLIRSGLKGMIGKGYRGQKVRQALKEYSAVHFSAVGGAGALLSKHIVRSEIIAYEDLGTEAIRQLEVVNFPVIVAYDAHGNSVNDKERKL